jgi:hypothetical protein
MRASLKAWCMGSGKARVEAGYLARRAYSERSDSILIAILILKYCWQYELSVNSDDSDNSDF